MRASLLTRAGSLAAAAAVIATTGLVYKGNVNFAPSHSRFVTARP